jgi:hypothetical protein
MESSDIRHLTYLYDITEATIHHKFIKKAEPKNSVSIFESESIGSKMEFLFKIVDKSNGNSSF